MKAHVLGLQADEGNGTHTRWCMTASTIAHAAFLIALFTLKPSHVERDMITEVTWLEPGEAGGGAAATAARVAARPAPGVAVLHRVESHFKRETRSAEMEPATQSDVAYSDRMRARLATLAQNDAPSVASGGHSPVPASVWGGGRSTSPTSGGGGGRLALTRGGGVGSGPAVALTRGAGLGGGTATPTLARAAAVAAEKEAAAPAAAGDSRARRSLAGAQLIGPVADRPIVHYSKPSYPEWAKRDAVEGAVTLYFVVRADGTVKENILVQKTAGFEDFDESARAALRSWRFQPLAGGRAGEQWGTITFHFRLAGGG